MVGQMVEEKITEDKVEDDNAQRQLDVANQKELFENIINRYI